MAKLLFVLFLLSFGICLGKKYNDGEKPQWAKKDIRDFSDADMER